jgi:hypothetical protein
VVHNQVLSLPGGVALNRYDYSGRLALDFARVLLDEAVVAVVAGELDLLVFVYLAGVADDFVHGLRPLYYSLHRRALAGHVVGQIV